MNLVGKIFVVAILVMSVVYMAFAMTVYSTHKSWRDMVERSPEQAGPGKPVGLRWQLDALKAENAELKTKLLNLDAELAAEEAAARQQLAKLETESEELKAERKRMQTDLDELEGNRLAIQAAFTSAQENLSRLTAEIAEQRTLVTQTQLERDDKFNKAVSADDARNIALGQLNRLKERLGQLTGMIAQYKSTMRTRGIDPDRPIAAVPPRVDGIVTRVAKPKPGQVWIEVSIGSDDGLLEEHELEVYRNQTYVGRAKVKTVKPDVAVAEMLNNFLRVDPQANDRVTTRLDVAGKPDQSIGQ